MEREQNISCEVTRTEARAVHSSNVDHANWIDEVSRVLVDDDGGGPLQALVVEAVGNVSEER